MSDSRKSTKSSKPALGLVVAKDASKDSARSALKDCAWAALCLMRLCFVVFVCLFMFAYVVTMLIPDLGARLLVASGLTMENAIVEWVYLYIAPYLVTCAIVTAVVVRLAFSLDRWSREVATSVAEHVSVWYDARGGSKGRAKRKVFRKSADAKPSASEGDGVA